MDYSEKVYESHFRADIEKESPAACDIEPIDQVLEAVLGYDLGAQLPAQHPLWRRIGVMPGAGRNIQRAPGVRASDPLTATPRNAFFQFKGPRLMHGANARWRTHFGGDYLRFTVDRRFSPGRRSRKVASQHQTLCELERTSGWSATVRYAASTAKTYAELVDARNRGRTVTESIFVPPSAFEPDHLHCSYTSPHNARLNPDPDDLTDTSWASVTNELITETTPLTFAEQVHGLRAALDEYVPSSREPLAYLIDELRAQGVGDEAVDTITTTLAIQDALLRFDIAWFVASTRESVRS